MNACWLKILTRFEFQVQNPEIVYVYDSPVTYPICRQKTWASKLDQPLPQIVPSLPSTDRTTIPPPFTWLSAREKRTPSNGNVNVVIFWLVCEAKLLYFNSLEFKFYSTIWCRRNILVSNVLDDQESIRLSRISSKCNMTKEGVNVFITYKYW